MTPEEWNQKKQREYDEKQRQIHKSPVKCPLCGTGMIYSIGGLLISKPPQRNVECPQCDYRDRIFV